MEYLVRKSEIVFEGKVFNVRIDEVEHAGKRMRVDLIEHNGAVILVPMDSDGKIWLVDQYRHPAGDRLLELPAGSLDPNEEPEACAIRECREEIGMAPGKLTQLGGFYLAPGYSVEYARLYLAQDLTPSPLPRDEDEDLHIRRLSLPEIEALITEGAIRDGKTLAGIFLTQRYLRR
jgi:ADP-ribose pyrophosphatase